MSCLVALHGNTPDSDSPKGSLKQSEDGFNVADAASGVTFLPSSSTVQVEQETKHHCYSVSIFIITRHLRANEDGDAYNVQVAAAGICQTDVREPCRGGLDNFVSEAGKQRSPRRPYEEGRLTRLLHSKAIPTL